MKDLTVEFAQETCWFAVMHSSRSVVSATSLSEEPTQVTIAEFTAGRLCLNETDMIVTASVRKNVQKGLQ